ncbi:MAG: 4Fe-4S binding protein, partial [Desulfovibrionaceae bacterium]|nr:4Fe-4S binding protein [Desulfovibrionaceae bacterium]
MKMPDRYTAARRLVQISVICAFCALPWLNAGGEGRFPVRGSLFALDLAGLPFADPVAALQALAQTAAGCLPGARLLLGACCSLALAFFMGRVFCSWICPYGFLSEMVRRLRPAKGPAKAANKDHARAFAVRSGLLAAGVIAAAAFGFPALELLSMPGELSLTPLAIWGEGTGLTALFVLLCLALPLAALAAEALAGRRLWCRFVC